MKKLIALLLVICVVFGLAACGGKKTDDTAKDPTGDESAEGGPTAPTLPNINATNPTTGSDITTDQFRGITLEIYGNGTQDSYTDYEQFGKGNYVWMMRAAMMEWAEMNGVTLVFKGSYNQSAILADMSSGGKPDIIFHTEQFPMVANVGLIAYFTEAEYNKLAEVCDSKYLDLLNYKTVSHGVVFPWTGNTMCYYNKTMFEDYGVKTPKEYFMEGNWTWTTFLKCMEEMTKDVDADGVMDTYGLPGDSMTWGRMGDPWKTDENGRLVNTIDDPMIQDFIQFKYDVFAVKKCAKSDKNKIQTNVIYPMYAMQLSDCEPYNFEHLYQEIPNGNELEVVPVPAYDGDGGTRNILQWTQACVSLAATCDHREAAIDMLCYLLKCGQKYVSDFSLGAVACEYDGIQGTCEVSANWKAAFAQVCADRTKDLAKIDAYDPELIAKIYESFEGAEWYTFQRYTGVDMITSYSEITKMPPESSIPIIKNKFQAAIDTYNSKYIK